MLSQLTAAVMGQGWFYYVTIGSVLTILSLSANTSFVDFPRLCRLIAEDDFLPRSFAIVGRRLVATVGVLFLAAAAGLLLVAFDGVTDRLIPLSPSARSRPSRSRKQAWWFIGESSFAAKPRIPVEQPVT